MSKRLRHDEFVEVPPPKRLSPNQPDRLSSLSDEILLNILTLLPIPALILCQK
jgi:hypothetical protein